MNKITCGPSFYCFYYQNNRVIISWKCHYFPQITDLSVGWLVGRSGHCTVSGPSGDGVSGTPSGRGDSAACCSSVRGCSNIQLANTSMVWESRSPATSGRDHREVQLSEFKKKRCITERCVPNLSRIWPTDYHPSVCHLSSRCQICSDNTNCVTSVQSLLKEGLTFEYRGEIVWYKKDYAENKRHGLGGAKCIQKLSPVKNIKCHACAENQNKFTFTCSLSTSQQKVDLHEIQMSC